MSKLSKALKTELEGLPQNQKLFYNSLLERGDQNIFQAVKDIHREVTDGTIEPEYQRVASLALAALNETLNGPRATRPMDDNLAAHKHILKLIDEAEIAGDDGRAEMLRESILHTQQAEQERFLRNAELRANHDKVMDRFAEQKQTRYEKTLRDEKDRIVQSLRRNPSVTQDEAEAQYEASYRKQTERAVATMFGET